MTGDRCWWLKDKNIVLCVPCNADNENLNKDKPKQSEFHSGATEVTKTITREETIAKAHAENMAANQELVMAIRQLTVAVNDRTRFLKQVDYECKELEAKP